MKSTTRQTLSTWAKRASIVAAATFLVLLIPDCDPPVPARPASEPFVWNSDELWSALERRFDEARDQGCNAQTDDALERASEKAAQIGAAAPGPDDPAWAEAEQDFFALSAQLGGCPERLSSLLKVRNALRRAIKRASIGWTDGRAARDRTYRTLYGTRAAVEELILQAPPDTIPPLDVAQDVASATPSTVIEGLRIHSGDLLLSRGGAPTSAFIARGNDYPGNFSHVALVHVDGTTGDASVIEAHIERGVAIADPKAYFKDKKLRILVLRMRPDHPALRMDPMLPHDAAKAALHDAKSRHIPYDFAMDFADPAEQFCSEVASANYRPFGVELWKSLSTFSSPGLARWMAAFGVEQLETHSPSDLEYDPSLAVVAEWLDEETLMKDHLDNAIIDAMLEQAEAGADVGHDWWMLPVARVAKAYSWALGLAGAEGPVPEGMSATVALRATWLAKTHNAAIAKLDVAASEFRQSHGYAPPYWELVKLARTAVAQ